MNETLKGTILVVDDEEPIRELLTLILEGEDYAVKSAADGEAALLEAFETPPDVILLDLKMPGMDGTAFAQQYRERGGRAPIVVITAARGVEHEAAAVEPCAYLAKPFDLEALLDTISSCGPMAAAGPQA